MAQKAAANITGSLDAPTSEQVPLSFSPKDLTQEQIADIRLAASRMSGCQRRGFMAEMSLKYCSGSPRLTESIFGWSRDTVETGLGEKRTGILCIGFQSSRCGNKAWEEKHPEMAEFVQDCRRPIPARPHFPKLSCLYPIDRPIRLECTGGSGIQ